jgi:hypothetical protein
VEQGYLKTCFGCAVAAAASSSQAAAANQQQHQAASSSINQQPNGLSLMSAQKILTLNLAILDKC